MFREIVSDAIIGARVCGPAKSNELCREFRRNGILRILSYEQRYYYHSHNTLLFVVGFHANIREIATYIEV